MIDWATIISAAAVGSIASTALTLLGQALERRSRQREVMLAKAVDLARWKNDRTFQYYGQGERRGRAQIDDEIYLVRTFFEDLEHLFNKGKLTTNSESYYVREVKRVREARDEGEEVERNG